MPAYSDSPEHNEPRNTRDSYLQLGLEPGATMREIEAAYWQFARELRGQAAMAPYSKAYEALVTRAKPPAQDTRQDTPAPPAAAQEQDTPAACPPSKFGWPSN